jgi:hypothetical protein
METEANNLPPFLVNSQEASALLRISKRHFLSLDKTGAIGPQGIRLGHSIRWNLQHLRDWTIAGCPPRRQWSERQSMNLVEGARK